VQAVRTTGIYCRPDCSARPSPANVAVYPSPAAAEAAGYRACLRCRPYRDDAPIVVEGPELVCRAVQLVVDGALDDATESHLAARVGVSARHLRRLFDQHVGVTPDQLARSRRVHFARRLLDDTDLPVGEVALAAGFGSVRQLHRATREVFRASPTELRARRRRGDRLVADGGLDLRVPLGAPIDWPATAGWLAERAVAGVETVAGAETVGGSTAGIAVGDDPCYRRTIEVDGDPGVVELGPRLGADQIRMRVHLPHWHGLIHLVQRARRLLGPTADLLAADAHLGADPLLGPLVRRRPGLRPAGCWDPLEVGVRTVVGQQIRVSAATTVMGRLVSRHGRPVAGLGSMGLDALFPSAATLAVADLDGLGLTGARVDAVRSFATAVVEDQLPLDRSIGLEELVARLRELRGIGAWSAHYIALRLGEPDAFPSGDVGLRLAGGELTGTHRLSPSELEHLAERWRPWRAIAAAHLWAALRDPRPGGGTGDAGIRRRG
jgi:AraC family transcriptional regulator of adaptative response / DNA-3-methyladenine glycosylase II